MRGLRLILGCIATLVALVAAGPAHAARTSKDVRFTTSDGVSLQTTVSGEAPLAPRPTMVEFSPYGDGSESFTPSSAYNVLLVQIRGTGDSDGRFDALGDRTQADVAEVLQWACHQPWSDGNLALNGFSASAIMVYHSLHLALPCVRAAVLKSGTFELYRDLLWPGGIHNFAVGLGVLGLISAPAVAQGGDRLQRNPGSTADTAVGINQAGNDAFMHSTLDSWWQERSFRGDVNHLPILMVDGFFDVESRGAFQAYQQLRGDGAHLLVVGAHDGAPAGTDAGNGEMQAWFDHYVRGADNGVELHPRVQMWLADGDREDDLHGKFVRYDASDWPVPRTRWESLRAAPDRSLALSTPKDVAQQPYPALPSPPSSSDPPNTAILGPNGVNQLADAFPFTTEMEPAQRLGLSFTTAPFSRDVLSAGPASLELRLSSTAPETGIWSVISDVAPDGTAHPVASGRLLNAYPHIDRRRSLRDRRTGAIVQPYGRYDAKDPAAPGEARLYRVEFWPIGNRFKRGHRLRLHILGQSAASLPNAPAVNTVEVGGRHGARLLVPVLPGSSLRAALRPAG
jgi:putative CocE/NonD family hydrolase